MKNSLEAAALRALLQRSHGPAASGDGGDDDAAGVVNFHIYIYIPKSSPSRIYIYRDYP